MKEEVKVNDNKGFVRLENIIEKVVGRWQHGGTNNVLEAEVM